MGLQVNDFATGKVVKTIASTAATSSNDAVRIPEFDLGLSYNETEAVGTQAGVRTFALHPKTKKLYDVAAEGGADYAKKITTSVSPYYANTFFPDRFYVLTYSK